MRTCRRGLERIRARRAHTHIYTLVVGQLVRATRQLRQREREGGGIERGAERSAVRERRGGRGRDSARLASTSVLVRRVTGEYSFIKLEEEGRE